MFFDPLPLWVTRRAAQRRALPKARGEGATTKTQRHQDCLPPLTTNYSPLTLLWFDALPPSPRLTAHINRGVLFLEAHGQDAADQTGLGGLRQNGLRGAEGA